MGRTTITSVTVLKAVSCYEYQSCEHPKWEHSDAYKLCQVLRAEAIVHLPGYVNAPWGIE